MSSTTDTTRRSRYTYRTKLVVPRFVASNEVEFPLAEVRACRIGAVGREGRLDRPHV